MKTVYKSFLLVLTLVINTCLLSNQSIKTEDLKGYALTLSLPVNVTLPKCKRIHLNASIPKEFSPVNATLDAPMQEFIPSNEKVEKWSQIITTRAFLDQRVAAETMISGIKQGISSQVNQLKVIEEKIKNYGIYTEGTLIIMYSYNSRTEVMAARYCSGPYDCSGVQYTILVSLKMTESMALNKVKTFLDKNV